MLDALHDRVGQDMTAATHDTSDARADDPAATAADAEDAVGELLNRLLRQ